MSAIHPFHHVVAATARRSRLEAAPVRAVPAHSRGTSGARLAPHGPARAAAASRAPVAAARSLP